MRQHPDWFTAGGGACTDWMENWPLMIQNKIPPMPVWPYTVVAGDSLAPLEWHARELVETRRNIGWDGVRYDSYSAIAEANIKATKIVRDLVARQEPGFRWGYNSSVPKDVQSESLDIMCRGGQMVMEEGLRHAAMAPTSFATYLATLAGYRDTVWQHDGHLGLCYDAPGGLRNGTLLDQVYLCCCLLAAGCHPYYLRMDRVMGDFPGFALRYGEFLYDNKMRPLPEPAKIVTFGGNPPWFQWERLAKQADLGHGRRRLVLHLINPPADDLTLHNETMATRSPLRNVPVAITLRSGAKEVAAWTLCPIPTAHHVPLTVQMDGDHATLALSEIRFWTVLVVEFAEVDR